MPELFLNYVGGRWLGSESKQTFPNINPANCNDVVGLFQSSSLEDVTAAFAAVVTPG